MTKTKILLCLAILSCSIFYGQLDSYSYKNQIENIEDTWHSLTLPNEVLEHLNNGMTDLRIYGITATDTIEAPYLLKAHQKKTTKTPISFEYLNFSNKNENYFYTYKNVEKASINKIHLDFKQLNFDWRVSLEGSHNQKEWFTILEDYRIMSIINDEVAYVFTTLKFPNSNYEFYRLNIKSGEKPVLDTAGIELDKTEPATYRKYKTSKVTTTSIQKKTIVDIDLKQRVPVSLLSIKVGENFQYYRPMQIKYLADSIQTEKGIKYIYKPLGDYTLASVGDNSFEFENVLTQKLLVTINNFDNEPLTIKDVTVKGYLYSLIARFTEKADYYLAYGKELATRPNYDIKNIELPILVETKPLAISETQRIAKPKPQQIKALFEDKIWLWLIIGIVIIVMGYFTIQMLQKKN